MMINKITVKLTRKREDIILLAPRLITIDFTLSLINNRQMSVKIPEIRATSRCVPNKPAGGGNINQTSYFR